MHKNKRWTLIAFCFVLLVGSNTGLAYADACPSGGEHEYAGELKYQATDETDGLQEFTCLKCGDTYERVIPATGHHWGEWIVEVEPTCTSQGYSYRVCTAYSGSPHYEEKILDRLSATGEHSYVVASERAATCIESGYREYRCQVCGATYDEEIAQSGHAWGEWQEEIAPTATAEGREMRTCQHDSSHVEYRTLPTKGEAEEVQEKKKPSKPTQTTDTQKEPAPQKEEQPEPLPEMPVWFTFSFTPNATDAALLAGDVILLIIGTILIIPLAFQIRWIRRRNKESLDIYVEQGLAERKKEQ